MKQYQNKRRLAVSLAALTTALAAALAAVAVIVHCRKCHRAQGGRQ